MECSLVIRAYNEARHIGRLLEGVQHQTVRDVEMILVDSGSTDDTVAIASAFPALQVIHIQPHEFTFGRSLNRGIERATRPFVVIASAHIYPVYPDWLERLLDPFKDPQVGLCYGKQRGGIPTKFSEHQIFARWFPDQSVAQQPHPFCNNANAAVRRTLWEQHPYDETLPGLEDLAWARWIFEKGEKIAYQAEAEVIHLHDETPRGIYNRYRREGMAFKQIYPQEQFHFSDCMRLFWGNAASDLRRAWSQKTLGSAWRSILWFRWMQFWGTYQGYRQSGPLTWQLRQAFYYPHQALSDRPASAERNVQPIRYKDSEP